MAGIRWLVAAEMVENDNDAEMGTNMGMVKGELLSSYFGGRFIFLGTLQRVPAHAN
jgi:hypothetical protein